MKPLLALAVLALPALPLALTLAPISDFREAPAKSMT